IAYMWMVGGAGNSIGEESELGTRASWHVNAMHLHGISEAGPDEHLTLLWIPVENGGRARIRVTAGTFRNNERDPRDAVDDQVLARIVGRGCGRLLCGAKADEQQHGCEKE